VIKDFEDAEFSILFYGVTCENAGRHVIGFHSLPAIETGGSGSAGKSHQLSHGDHSPSLPSNYSTLWRWPPERRPPGGPRLTIDRQPSPNQWQNSCTWLPPRWTDADVEVLSRRTLSQSRFEIRWRLLKQIRISSQSSHTPSTNQLSHRYRLPVVCLAAVAGESADWSPGISWQQ